MNKIYIFILVLICILAKNANSQVTLEEGINEFQNGNIKPIAHYLLSKRKSKKYICSDEYISNCQILYYYLMELPKNDSLKSIINEDILKQKTLPISKIRYLRISQYNILLSSRNNNSIKEINDYESAIIEIENTTLPVFLLDEKKINICDAYLNLSFYIKPHDNNRANNYFKKAINNLDKYSSLNENLKIQNIAALLRIAILYRDYGDLVEYKNLINSANSYFIERIDSISGHYDFQFQFCSALIFLCAELLNLDEIKNIDEYISFLHSLEKNELLLNSKILTNQFNYLKVDYYNYIGNSDKERILTEKIDSVSVIDIGNSDEKNFKNQLDKIYYQIGKTIYSKDFLILSELRILSGLDLIKNNSHKYYLDDYLRGFNFYLFQIYKRTGDYYYADSLVEFNNKLGHKNLDSANQINNKKLWLVNFIEIKLLEDSLIIAEDGLRNLVELNNSFYKTNKQEYYETYPILIKSFHRIAKDSIAVNYFHEYSEYLKTSLFDFVFYLNEDEKNILIEKFKNRINYLVANNEELILKYSKCKYDAISLITISRGLLLQTQKMVNRKLENSNDNEIKQKYNELKKLNAILLNHYENINVLNKKQIDSINKIISNINKRISKSIYSDLLKIEKDNWFNLDTVINNLGDSDGILNIYRYYNCDGNYYGEISYMYIYFDKKNYKNPIIYFNKNASILERSNFEEYSINIKSKAYDNESFVNYCPPFFENLKGINRVFVSNDGVYHKINFETLINPISNDYLINQIQFININSLKDIKKQDKNTKFSATLIGDPTYFIDSTSIEKFNKSISYAQKIDYKFEYQRSSTLSNPYNQLPYTREEIKNISDIFKNYKISSTIFLGLNANESNLKEQKSPSILHIATHGFFIEDKNDEFFNPNETENRQNVLLRSGLVLAGAENTRTESNSPLLNENGIITAFEVQNMNLSKTELCVLSACESGLGIVNNGEGVYGLQRGFKLAGVKNIIMTLWKIDDLVTMKLMNYFYYDLIVNKASINDALKYAKIKIIEEGYTHAYYWGGFVVLGSN